MPEAASWSPGFAFFPPPGSPDGEHLWGVFSEPLDGEVLIANVTTLRRHSDRSGILQAGEHPRIRHESCMRYADSKVVAVEQLRLLRGLTVVEPFSEALVRRVVEGALRSEESPSRVKALLRALAARRDQGRGGLAREAAAPPYA